MTTRKGIHISETYVVLHKLYACFISELCILKS